MTKLQYNPAPSWWWPKGLQALRMKRQPPEIVITGFPKCGTTALVRGLEARDDVTFLRPDTGAAEMPWPQIRDIRFDCPAGQVVGHKNVAYIFNKMALTHLAEVNPDSVIVLCVRDPIKALVSWHRMHQALAREGQNKQHFAWKERDFYADADVAAYYDHFAADKLRYGVHFARLKKIVGTTDRLVVVYQSRLAADTGTVVDYLLARARGQSATLEPPPPGTSHHKGYADRRSPDIPPRIRNRLAKTWDNTQAAIARSGVVVCQ